MLAIYQALATLALREFSDVVSDSGFVGGTEASPNKLRLILVDGSFLEIWLSVEGDYSYHWERRRQRGRLYQWDNAPHHPHVSTFPDHFHDGDETAIGESQLSGDPELALLHVLAFIRQEFD